MQSNSVIYSAGVPKSPSSSSSSPPDHRSKYDVFLSFRGKDTRYKFTSHLYAALHGYGIHTFMDEPELRTGDVIRDALIQAIHDSKIYIVVFSENYASSSWCLDELLEIYKCYKVMNRLVIGVYCNIDPSVVRHQTDSFKQAFAKHETRFVRKMHKVNKWRLTPTMKRFVMGVYYNTIDPLIVQHQSKSFDKTFQKHKSRFRIRSDSSFKIRSYRNASNSKKVNKRRLQPTKAVAKSASVKRIHPMGSAARMARKERVKTWRQTLNSVADFSGKSISAERSEADIINEIVDRVLLEIKPYYLKVAKYPVGLDSRVKDVTALMSAGPDGVIRIGLYGLGGVGKTTLAKALYNDQFEKGCFKDSSFLQNVRENSETAKGMVILQQQLINDVLKIKNNIEVHNVEEGTELIKARICSTKVLVLIDDIDHFDQYENLVGPFARGSVVIITTKDEHILDTIKVNPKYMVNELSKDQSIELFTRHAFGDAIVNHNLMAMSADILDRAGGLPLALQLFGSNLLDVPDKGWRWFIENLNLIPVGKVEESFLISYKALKLVHPQLQDIFLDIACFFTGKNIEETVKILETYYPQASYSIDILKRRCLLTINNRCELEMHNLLQDMGKGIARNNYSLDEPEKHSRLWILKDIHDVLEEDKGTEAIKGIVSSFYHEDTLDEVSAAAETFKKMSKLRFLYLKNVRLAGSFKKTFKDLRWLRWDCCPLKFLPSEFHPQELVILVLRGSKMTTMWEPNMDSQVFKKLKNLDMSYSINLITTPDFIKLPCLETLNLEGCKSLEEIQISKGTLAKLVILNLRCCVNLRSLPDSIGNLRVLQSLNIGGCSRLETLPTELGKIESLAELTAWGLSVSNLKDCVELLNNLVVLNISDTEYPETLPASASTSSDLTSWDVFLSFRGKDTRSNFISHLYAALQHHGIRSFIDDPELQAGNEISDALMGGIRDSKIYLVVFSENYASSSWCLDELVEIYECHRTHGRPIFPVFYNIEPSEVRHQIGSFAQAFQKHQTRFQIERVKMWRHTLYQVSNIAGYHTTSNSYEAGIIDEVVEKVERALPKALNDEKYSVGIDSHIQGIVATLRRKTERVIKFGIYGPSGAGKTALAKALFDQLVKGSYEGSCFLENIGQTSRTSNGTQSLQQQLVNDVCRSKNIVKVHSIDHGKMLIAHHCSSKVLVVIDDVDNQEQYESLAGPFAPGSVVIVTTRFKNILDELQIETRYQYRLSQLDEAESWALFNRHARPSHTLKALSEEIIQFSSGLPIALEVVGSYLFKQSEERWVAYVEKLHRNPSITIQQQLLIIFEALKSDDPVLMAIFLDIACFFIGWKREEVVRILGTCYTFVDDNIDILRGKNLLTINYSNELCMSGLLQHMGREIVRNNYPNEPEKQSRLWKSKDIHDVLQNHKGTNTIEGIFSDQHASENVSFSAETFKRMSRLRFLYLKNVNLTGSFEQTFEGLRWLCWDWCPLTSLPSDLYFQELVILEMPHSKMKTLWELNMDSHVFQELQTLNMKYSEDLVTTPDFNRLPCLTTLNLAGCKSLEEVHQSIGNLVSLVSINLCDCVKLRVLPDSICRLSTLQVLRLNGCTSLDGLPANLGKIESLIELEAHGLNISSLPRSVGDLSNLVELIISSNKKLQTLPDTICNFKALRGLNIKGCSSLKALPKELGNITSLRKLIANSLSILKLPESVGRLTKLVELEIRYNEKLITLPDTICNLRSLESLDLKYCHRLMSIPKLPPNLMRIKADGCKTIERLPNLSKLKRMELLVLTDCTGLTELQGLKELSSIKKLHLGGCISSLLVDTLTECLFQAYSQFRHESQIYFPAAEFPDWITQSPDWTSHSNNIGSSMSLDLSPTVSHNFLSMILCFKYRDDHTYDLTTYSVKNTTSGFVWNGRFDNNYDEAQIVILPSSIFLVRDGDTRIELTANAEIVGIRLLYKPKITMIDDYDRSHQSEDLEFEEEKSLYHSEDLDIEEEQSYHSADLEIEEVRSYHSEDLGIKPETPSPVFTLYRWIIFTLRKWLNI